MSSVETLAVCLGPEGAARFRALAEGAGPYRTYVSGQQTAGLGKGLVRRHDALMNHVLSQGKAGRSESLTDLAARINLFRTTFAEAGAVHVPGCEVLLEHPAFIEGARRLSGRPVVQPGMLYANILLPGQELPLHTDTPAYRGLDQTTAPEWLLVCMAHSGLFEAWRVPMIGAVSFFGGCEGGDFVCFPGGDALRVPPAEDTAVIVATEAVFHGVARVGGPDHPPPQAPIGAEMHHLEGDRWVVTAKGETIAEHRWGAFRFSVQWKAKCDFEGPPSSPPLTRQMAEATLIGDLRARGLISGGAVDDTAAAVKMIQTYVQFPQAALR
jgi:hypothetical protein